MQTLPFFGASWCNNPTLIPRFMKVFFNIKPLPYYKGDNVCALAAVVSATRAISLYVNIFKFKDSKGIKVLINFRTLETSQVRLGLIKEFRMKLQHSSSHHGEKEPPNNITCAGGN
jgi:hypothetical protein